MIQSYGNRGRQSLLNGDDADAVVYLSQAIAGGHDSSVTRFMLARATQPFLAERFVASTAAERTWMSAYSPDGEQLAVDDGRLVRLLDAHTGQQAFAVEHAAPVGELAFSQDGSRLATSDIAGGLRTWDVRTGKQLWGYDDPEHRTIDAMAWSPDHTLLAVTMRDQTQIWNARTGTLRAAIAHRDAEYWTYLSFAADGERLAITVRDGVLLVDPRNGKQLRSIDARRVSGICFEPTGQRIAISTFVGEAALWNAETGKREVSLVSSAEPLSLIRCASDGSRFATASKLGSAWIWNASGVLLTTIHSTAAKISELVFDPSGHRVVLASTDEAARFFDADTGVLLDTIRAERAAVRYAALSPDGRSVVITGRDGSAHVVSAMRSVRSWSTHNIDNECNEQFAPPRASIVVVSCGAHGASVWNLATHTMLATLPSSRTSAIDNRVPAAIARDGSHVAIAVDDQISVYRLPEGVLEHRVSLPDRVTAMASRDRAVVAGDALGTLRIADGVVSTTLSEPGGPAVDAIAVGNDGRIVVADAALHLMRYRESQRVLFDTPLGRGARSLVLSADGRHLLTVPRASAMAEGTRVELWDVDSGTRITRLGADTAVGFSARFVRDDRQILTGSSDGVARLWDATTGELIRSFSATGSSVMDALLSPDGTQVVTAGSDGYVRFWDADTGALLWKLLAHDTFIAGMHFEGDDLVTRSSTGALAQWHLPALAPASRLREVLACLPVRFDAETGGAIEQPPCERDAGAVTVTGAPRRRL